MARELYNLGRVTGFSAYEVYVKQHASEDPVNPPASEREWLASSLAMGSSMLLKIPANTAHRETDNWVLDIQFPSNTILCAANTIIASYFRGEGVYNGNWATRVSSYGDLISNTSSSSPNGNLNHGSTIPRGNVGEWDEDEKERLADYMKIVDGIIIHPGTWSASEKTPPQKDFIPNMGDYPRIRLHIRGPINHDLQILLTGFTIRTVVKGLTGLDGSTNTTSPQSGDFLGPGQFPWSAKVIFSVPTSYISFFAAGAYIRKLPTTSESVTVKDTAVIDMQATKPETYYEANYQGARVELSVDDFTTLGDGTAVLTVYQKSAKFPPAIWGTFVDSKGRNYLNPLDVVAPGTVKMFEDATEEELKEYETIFEGTFSINKNTEDGTIEIIGPDGTLVPAAEVEVRDATYASPTSGASKAKLLVTKTGKLTGLSLSMSSGVAGTQYTIGSDRASNATMGNTSYDKGSQTKLVPTSSNINWAMLLEALANNKSVDILGDNMKALKSGLNQQFPYIQFKNGLRLYISSTEPTPNSSIPVGSIGIGWTEE